MEEIEKTEEKVEEVKKVITEHRTSVWNFLVHIFKWLMSMCMCLVVFVMVIFIIAIFNPVGVKNAIDIIRYMFGGNI